MVSCQAEEPTSPFAALGDPTPTSPARSPSDIGPASPASPKPDSGPTSSAPSPTDTELRTVDSSPKTDRQVLTNIFHATNGEEWDDTATWASERPLGDWHGVSTDDEGRVTRLHLTIRVDPGDSPDGQVLAEIHMLDKLQYLYLFLRGLEVRIPAELAHLSELRDLDITGDYIRGGIPPELGELSRLERLYIHGESLQGKIPQGIFELENLQDLRISGEGLHADISGAAEALILGGATVNLDAETWTGCLSEYAYQHMSGYFTNLGTGPELPVCDSVHEGDLNALREIYSEWGPHGSMSNWLTRLPVHEWEGITTNRHGRVVSLDFYLGEDDGPRPSAAIPEAIGRLTALRRLELNSNGITGEIPGWIENLTELRELGLEDNELSGEVPGFLSAMPGIWQIYLSGNNLTGCLPRPDQKPLPPDLRGPLTEGPDGKPAIPMGVPELSGVEYCQPGETPTGATSTGAAAPLRARFLDIPASHDGQTEFTLELRFSEEFELSYRTLRDHALTVMGGEITNARRLEKPSNIRWEISVMPEGDGPVTLVLPATTDCAAPRAICAGNRRPMSTPLEITVPGQ